MSRNGVLLPIPPGSSLAAQIEIFTDTWPDAWTQFPAPRAKWLTTVESALESFYPGSSSADRKLTARHLAPFPLVLPGVV